MLKEDRDGGFPSLCSKGPKRLKIAVDGIWVWYIGRISPRWLYCLDHAENGHTLALILDDTISRLPTHLL